MKKSRLIGHIFSKEETKTPAFECPYCDKKYQSEAALKKHIADKHGDSGAFEEDSAE